MAIHKKGFIGIQVDGHALDGRAEAQVLDELQEQVCLNAVMLFHDDRARRGPHHHGGTPFRQPVKGLDDQGRDLLDRLAEPAKERGILLSRHYSEMKPELLRAAGDVIRRRSA